MSEKEKMQTEELAKIMDDAKPLGKSALSFMAGFVQGYKEAQSAVIFLLWGILNYYEKKEAQEAFREMSRSARYWKMVSEHRWSTIKELMERLHRWNGSGKS